MLTWRIGTPGVELPMMLFRSMILWGGFLIGRVLEYSGYVGHGNHQYAGIGPHTGFSLGFPSRGLGGLEEALCPV